MLNELDRFHLVDRRHRPRPGPRLARRARAAASGRQAARGTCVHPARGRRHARGRGLDLAGLDCVSDGADRAGAALARILVVNSGSSSLKLRVLGPGRRRRGLGGPGARSTATRTTSVRRSAALGPVDAVGHRIVHGATRFTGPVRARHRGRSQGIRSLTDLAPLHQPASLAGARGGAAAALPGRPGTSRASTRRSTRRCPTAASTYAHARGLARARWGLRRYGFHGLSHAYASGPRDRAAAVSRRRRGVPGRHLPPRRRRVAGGGSSAADRSTRRWASRRSRGS